MDLHCTRNRSNYFPWIVSFDSQNNPIRWIFIIISSIEQMRNLRSGEVKSLDKVTQLVYHRAGSPDLMPSPFSHGPIVTEKAIHIVPPGEKHLGSACMCMKQAQTCACMPAPRCVSVCTV